MKKFLVIGNPIEHSLSPILHNYWIKINEIDAIYEKQKLNENELEKFILQVREKKIDGINVTVPFKKSVIPYLDELSLEAKNTQSVNTIYSKDNKLIFALNEMKVSKINVSNRTKEKSQDLKKIFKNIEIVEWGEVPNFDMIINATSLGLKEEDKINLNFSSISKNKFFYDVIYNPQETNFLKTGKKLGNKILNGKLMFIYQALSAFNIWHGIKPSVNENIIKLLD